MKGIEFYEDIQTAPIDRWVEFNRLVGLQEDVGNTFEDMQMRDRSALEYLQAGNIEGAQKELSNKTLAKHFLKEGFYPCAHALACMVKSINGQPREDFSEQGRKETIALMSRLGFTFNDTEEKTTELKKKFTSRVKCSFLAFLSRMSLKLLL